MEIKNLVEEQNYIIVLDTNVLLNVYHYSPEFTEFALKCLNRIENHLYLPATVQLEYERHCHTEFKKMEKRVDSATDETKRQIVTASNKILSACSVLERIHFPDVVILREALSKNITDIHETLTDFFNDRIALDLIQHSWAGTDYIKELVENIKMAKHIFPEPTQREIYAWCEEGVSRYKKETPPGFKDTKNKDGVRKYSDLIIWKEILRFAKSKRTNVIFVTDDDKPDWWESINGKRQFHSCLTSEFQQKTCCQIQALSSQDFYTAISSDFNIEQTDSVEIALRMTDNDYYKKVAEQEKKKIEEELMYNGIKYIDESSTHHIGTEGIDEFVITEHCFNTAYQIERTDFTVIYEFVFSVTLEGRSYDYWGRDDDTHEVIISDGRDHIFQGELVVQVERETGAFIDFTDDESFMMAFIAYSNLIEADYYDVEKIVANYCPDCSRPLTPANDVGGMCADCAAKEE